MKQLFYILFICILGCNKTTSKKDLNKSKQKTIITKNSESDSLVNRIFKYENSGDTIKTDTFKLKKNYTLIIFPTIDKNQEQIKFRLINGKKDNTCLLAETFEENYIPYFRNIDFQNYFALHSNGGGTSNLYFWLYDKETGNEVLKDSYLKIQIDFDLKNELILYEDEDDNYNFFIYDVNSKVKTFIDIPYDLMGKYECTKYNDSYKTIYIKRVSNYYYYLGFRDCPSKIEFRVKKVK